MGIQILIPHDKNKEFMLSTTIPAIVSVGLNLLFLPHFGFIGCSHCIRLNRILGMADSTVLYSSLPQGSSNYRVYDKNYVCICCDVWPFAPYKTIPTFHPTLNVLVYAVLGGIIYLIAIPSLRVVDVKELKQQFLNKR